MKPGTSRSMVITDLPACRKKSRGPGDRRRARSRVPPTTSTSGMRYGGLKGWPTTVRSGWAHLVCISLIAVAGGGGRDHHVRRGRRVDVGQQGALELEVLGRALLDEVRLRAGCRQVALDGEVVEARALGEAELGQRRPRRVDQVPQPCLGVLGRVPGHDAVAAGQEVRRPAAADHAGADAGDGPDVLRSGPGHRGFSARISRPSSGVATWAPMHSTMRPRPLDELGVGRLHALAQVEVVLQADPDVPAEQHRLRHPRHLHRAERERRPHGVLGQLVDHRRQRQRVGRARRTGCPCTAGTSPGRRSAPPRPASWRTTGGRCRRSPSRSGRRAPGSSWRPRAACRACET